MFGAATAAAFSCARRVQAPGPVAIWVADRSAHEVVGLGDDAIPVLRVPVRAPVRLVPMAAGCLVEYVVAGYASGETRWVRITTGGRCELAARSEVLRALADPTRDDVSDAGRSAYWRLGEPGGPSRFLERWVRRPSQMEWTGDAHGEGLAFRFRLPWTARALAADQDGVWVAADRLCSFRRISHSGVHRFDVDFKDADGVEAVTLDGHGGLLAACAGALVRIDAEGRRLPGQGGFLYLVDVARAPSRSR